jgi:Zinc-finger of C2H2 type
MHDLATTLSLQQTLDRHPSWAHCTTCGVTFTSNSAFDAHLGPIPRSGPPRCKHPSEVKKGQQRLIYDEARGVWKWDGERPSTGYEAA